MLFNFKENKGYIPIGSVPFEYTFQSNHINGSSDFFIFSLVEKIMDILKNSRSLNILSALNTTIEIANKLSCLFIDRRIYPSMELATSTASVTAKNFKYFSSIFKESAFQGNLFSVSKSVLISSQEPDSIVLPKVLICSCYPSESYFRDILYQNMSTIIINETIKDCLVENINEMFPGREVIYMSNKEMFDFIFTEPQISGFDADPLGRILSLEVDFKTVLKITGLEVTGRGEVINVKAGFQIKEATFEVSFEQTLHNTCIPFQSRSTIYPSKNDDYLNNPSFDIQYGNYKVKEVQPPSADSSKDSPFWDIFNLEGQEVRNPITETSSGLNWVLSNSNPAPLEDVDWGAFPAVVEHIGADSETALHPPAQQLRDAIDRVRPRQNEVDNARPNNDPPESVMVRRLREALAAR